MIHVSVDATSPSEIWLRLPDGPARRGLRRGGRLEIVVFVVRVAGAFGRLGRHRAERVADARSLDPSLIGSRAVGVRDGAHVGPRQLQQANLVDGAPGRRRPILRRHRTTRTPRARDREPLPVSWTCTPRGASPVGKAGTGRWRGGGSEISGWWGCPFSRENDRRVRRALVDILERARERRRSPRPRRRRPYTGRRAAARVATPSRRGATLRFSQRRVPGEKLRCHRRACGTEIFSDRCSSPHAMGLAHRGRLDPRRVPRRRPHRYPRFASIHTGINEFMF